MGQIIINISTPNDGLGDALRHAFDLTNQMFTELYNLKVSKVTGKDLSDNNYADADVTKLLGIEALAEVNVQSDWNQGDDTQADYIKNKPTSLFFNDVYLAEFISAGVEDFAVPVGVKVCSIHVERGFKLSTEWSQLETVVTITGLVAVGKRVSIFGLL